MGPAIGAIASWIDSGVVGRVIPEPIALAA